MNGMNGRKAISEGSLQTIHALSSVKVTSISCDYKKEDAMTYYMVVTIFQNIK